MQALPTDTDQIVITASRVPETKAQSPASVTILDGIRIERLGEPLIPTLLRLVPSTAVTISGPQGSLTEVRIRGAESNHTLLFVDGIKINDPASGDIPRFELLNADLASRIEIVRGPQSALWGSDAIGGVVAINGLDDQRGMHGSIEGGSFGSRRASAAAALMSGAANLSGAIGWQRATGIDSFGAPGGDKDGYRNLSGRLRGTVTMDSGIELGASALALTGRTQFDGYNPATFVHEDTLDTSRNRLAAGRLWIEFGHERSPWRGRIGASVLGSANRNSLAGDPVNRTAGTRRTVDTQVERRFTIGPWEQRLIFAAEADRESFRSRDTIYGGATNQSRRRDHQAITAEYRAVGDRMTAEIAIRRDLFEGFRDATSLRTGLLIPVVGNLSISGSYARGIAPPTFFDLYGFFPGNFVGNPRLRPETSQGFELGLRFSEVRLGGSLSVYHQRLHNEIVDVFDPATFIQTTANRDRNSLRSGLEAEAFWQIADKLRLTANYAFLRATQPTGAAGRQVVELRRPKHSGSIAADGALGRWSFGASIAYVGAHRDSRDNFPFDEVRLGSYWLAGARVAYSVKPGIELFLRGTNLFDAQYQETAGYRTEGLGLFAGIRLAGRQSSQ